MGREHHLIERNTAGPKSDPDHWAEDIAAPAKSGFVALPITRHWQGSCGSLSAV